MLPNGTVVDDKFQIEELLGVGGYGRVYRATQLQFDRPVALKMLDTTLLYEADGTARFEREAKAVSALQHKNIVSFYGFGSWQRAPYMVMELVAGTPLEELLRNQQALDSERALRLVAQVFEALSCAHKAGVIHRDLKPSNIMVALGEAGEEQLKIIDFGLARLMPGYGIEGQKLTETGYALGTCHYMAPEQALGEPVDQRSDIYSAGCIFYQMLSGRRPFDADDNMAVMFQHLNLQPEPLLQYLPPSNFSQNLISIVENCMVKDRQHRYQTCEDVLADIKLVQSHHSSKVRKLDSKPTALAPQKKRNRAILIASTMSVSALLFSVGYGLWSYQQAENRKDSAKDAGDAVSSAIHSGDVQRVLFTGDPTQAYKIMSRLQTEDMSAARRFSCWVDLGSYFRELAERSFAEKAQYESDAQHCISEAAQLFDQVADDVSVERHQWILARALTWARKSKESFPILKAIVAHHNLKEPAREAECRAELAVQYMKMGDLKSATEIMQQAPDLLELAGKDGNKGFIYSWAGDLCYLNGDLNGAARYYTALLPIKWNAWDYKLRSLLGMTYVSLQQHRLDEARNYADKALRYSTNREGDEEGYPPDFEALLAQMVVAAAEHKPALVERFRKEAVANVNSFYTQGTCTSLSHYEVALRRLNELGYAAQAKSVQQSVDTAWNEFPEGNWIRWSRRRRADTEVRPYIHQP